MGNENELNILVELYKARYSADAYGRATVALKTCIQNIYNHTGSMAVLRANDEVRAFREGGRAAEPEVVQQVAPVKKKQAALTVETQSESQASPIVEPADAATNNQLATIANMTPSELLTLWGAEKVKATLKGAGENLGGVKDLQAAERLIKLARGQND